jgi:hypothetical protein
VLRRSAQGVFSRQLRPTVLEAPQAAHAVALHDVNRADVSRVDAQAASLGELFHAGFPGPLNQAMRTGTNAPNLKLFDHELGGAGRGASVS